MRFGLFAALGLIFTTLKLCSVIDWSWWWVLLPFYGGFALVAIFFIVGLVLVGWANSR